MWVRYKDIKKDKTIFDNLLYLWRFFGKNRKAKFIFLIFLMLISIFTEMLSIGAVIPFLTALTNPEILMKLEWFRPILSLFNITQSSELILPLTIGFVSISIIAGVVRISLLWVNTKLSASMGVELRREVYSTTLYRPYEYHTLQNSSNLISMTTEKVNTVIHTSIIHVLLLISAFLSSISIIVMLIFISPVVALSTFIILGGGYILVGYLVRVRIRYNGDIIAKNHPQSVKYVQEGLGGIRDIIMNNSQSIFIQLYENVVKNIQFAVMNNTFLSNLPKSLLEMLSIILIVILAYYLQSIDDKLIVPILGALALGTQRLLPSLQQIYFSWTHIISSQKFLEEIVEVLSDNKKSFEVVDNSLEFNHNIILKDISFAYKNEEKYVLKNINIEIKKGQKIGFIGTTGSGKSTLLDIVMGLLSPSKGELKVDNIKIDSTNIIQWRSLISHVPQSIFLSDTSLAENIAFGIDIDAIDLELVKKCAKDASLESFILGLPKQYKTTVGERGVQLSGGQRQRIGIARSLYKQAQIIVFDEATSALDNDTEASVMDAVHNLDKDLTIFIIAHRLSTLKECDVIYRLEDGMIVDFGSYRDMIIG